MAQAPRLVYYACLVYSLLFFAVWTMQIKGRRKPDYSIPRGSGLRGVLAAFTTGMLPWRKESAKLEPLSYTAGILYHLASFSSLVILAFPGLLLGAGAVFFWVLTAGVACGLYLLMKRVFKKRLRFLSGPGDYAANLVVDLMQLSVLLAITGVVPPVVPYFVTCAVLLYLPFGKLRHCYFFFASRLLLGRSYGRRGVYI
jgi:hypothetical protein